MWFLGFVAFSIALVVTVALIRLLLEFALRICLTLLASVGLGIIGGLIADYADFNGISSGLLIACLGFTPAAMLIWRWRDRANDAPTRRTNVPCSSAGAALASAPVLVERNLAIANSEALIAAWNAAQKLAPDHCLQSARNACARFLALCQTTSSLDPSVSDHEVLIRKHVPALIDETVAVCDGASLIERNTAISGMVDDLERMAAKANELMDKEQETFRERLKIRRAHLAERLPPHTFEPDSLGSGTLGGDDKLAGPQAD